MAVPLHHLIVLAVPVVVAVLTKRVVAMLVELVLQLEEVVKDVVLDEVVVPEASLVPVVVVEHEVEVAEPAD